jgi:hypothetical protein
VNGALLAHGQCSGALVQLIKAAPLSDTPKIFDEILYDDGKGMEATLKL